MPAVPFLSEAWCELVVAEAKSMPVVLGATGVRSATIRFPDESRRSFVMHFVDGVITQVTIGEREGAYAIEMPLDVYLALNENNFEAFDRGILHGVIRMTGNEEDMQAIAPLMRSAGYQGVLNRVHAQTVYD